MSIEKDSLVILEELKKVHNSKFTGKLTLTINMNEGGIGQMSLNLERNLKKSQKT